MHFYINCFLLVSKAPIVQSQCRHEIMEGLRAWSWPRKVVTGLLKADGKCRVVVSDNYKEEDVPVTNLIVMRGDLVTIHLNHGCMMLG